MRNIRTTMVVFGVVLLLCQALLFINKKENKKIEHKVAAKQEIKINNYESYEGIISQLELWHKQFPESTSFTVYGKSAEGKDCAYLRIGTKDKPKILVHSGVRGFEQPSVLTNMKLLDRLLHDRDEEIAWLLKNRDIYFIPVVSPDLFIHENKKANNVFPTGTKIEPTMTASIKNLVDLANELKFKAVLNLHSEGKNISYPQKTCNKDFATIQNVVQKMSDLSGYDIAKPVELMNSDVNWFYSTGACSINMNTSEVNLRKTYDAFVAFMKEAAESDMNPQPIRPIFYQAD